MTKENDLLKNWKLKLGLLAAIVIPTITATGAFYDVKAKIQEKDAAVAAKIADLELKSMKEFVDKDTVKEIQEDLKTLRTDVTEIKTLIKQRLR